MRRKSVVFKLFVITSLFILVVFSSIALAEATFFERFYRGSKLSTLERNINEFATQLEQSKKSNGLVSPQLGLFMNENDATVAVLNSSYNRVKLNPYFIKLETPEKTITVILPSGMMYNDIPQGLEQGDQLLIDGIYMDQRDTILHPTIIAPTNAEPDVGSKRVEGKITEILLPEHRSYNPLYQDMLLDDVLKSTEFQDEISLSRSHLQTKGQPSVIGLDWTDEWSGVEYAVLIRPLLGIEQQPQYVVAMTSLQPVGEAVGILQKYVIYTAPIIVLLVLLLSLVYSKLISRPLVLLNRSAQQLAKLDFSEQLELRSKDEFGELSRSMTTLSRNLDNALQELSRTNEQLREQIKDKERAEQLRKELIANISHELKTPLGVVKGFAEGLQDGVAAEKKERYLSLIVSETDRMNALIMDMLELSKYEVHAVQIQPSRVHLPQLIEGVLQLFTQQLDNKQLGVELLITDRENLYVTADAKRIEQVILNLLSNAIRHAVAESTIKIRIHSTENERVITTIENIGTPIAQEDLDRIWDQFYRAERSRDRKSGGTGLGLAIVKHILQLHDSEFDVTNTANGVAFTFSLQENRLLNQ